MGESRPAPIDRLIGAELDELDATLHSFRRMLEEISAVRPVDADEAKRLIGRLGDLVAAVRSRAADAARRAGSPLPEWATRSEFEVLIQSLASTLEARALERPRAFLRDLASIIGSHVVVHRSKQAADERNELRLRAQQELVEATRRPESPVMPGPQDPPTWLPWAWNLVGEEFAKLDAALRELLLPALGELVREVEPAWWRPAPDNAALRLTDTTPRGSITALPPAESPLHTTNTSEVEQQAAASEPTSSLPGPTPLAISGADIAAPTQTDGGRNGKTLPTGATAHGTAPEKAPAATRDNHDGGNGVVDIVQFPSANPSVVPSADTAVEPTPSAEPDEMPNSSGTEPATDPTLVAPRFPTDVSASAIALSIKEDSRPTTAWGELAWALIGERRHTDAYWLSTALASAPSIVARSAPMPQLAECLSWCDRTMSQDGAAATRLRELYTGLDYSRLVEKGEDGIAHQLLALATTIQPSLMAPFCGTLVVLETLQRELDGPLLQFVEIIIEFARRGQPLVVSRVRDFSEWQAQLAELRHRVDKWSTTAAVRTVNYAPATNVWREWQKVGGPIHALLAPIRTGDASQRGFVRNEIERLSSHSQFDDQVDRTRRNLGIPNPIIARALGQLRHFSAETLEYAEEWLRLLDSEPQADSDRERLARFKVELLRLRPLVIQQIESYSSSWESRLVTVSGATLIWAITTGVKLLEGQAVAGGDIADRRRLLVPSLLMAGVPIDASGEPAEPVSMVARQILHFVAHPRTWAEAFHSQLDRKDLATARVVLETIGGTVGASTQSDFEQRLATRAAQCKAELATAINDARRAIEEAVLNDVIVEEERSRLAHRVEMISQRDVLDFAPPLAELAGLRRDLDERMERRARDCRDKLAQLSSVDAPARERIERAIASRELSAAVELVALARLGKTLPEEDEARGRLVAFFPEGARAIAKYLESDQGGAGNFIKSVREGRPISGLESTLSGDRAREAANALEVWFDLKRRGARDAKTRPQPSDLAPKVTQLLKWIGFDARIEPLPMKSGRMWFDVHAAIPSRCPVPMFGSVARGRYRLLLTWERPPDDRLLEWVDQDVRDSAVVVLHFGRMEEQARRDLARRSREARRSPIVIDDVLLAFLSGEREGRLGCLFDCALPFAFSNPYMPYAAGNVPPEMFVGRSQELREVADQYGSCFIYGGRQLGKSALLRAAERNFTDENRGRLALYVDLKSEGIPEHVPAKELWTILSSRLKEKSIISASITNLGADGIVRHVKQWLDAEGDRRVLLLLDEADALLDHDARSEQNFAIVGRLKNLMESTDRRFKVVFAGLHNVQRFLSIPNQPLAHFGRPISVGPLEPRFALELVERPLRALGFQFKSRELALRIVSHANHQPSLIQLFGHELVEHLAKAVRFDVRTTPPCVVTGEHIDEVYRSQDLRARIRERFEWTLNLDTRYRVLAYTAAHLTFERPTETEDGLTLRELSDHARGFWRKGFEGTSEDELRGIVEEMVGLGLFAEDAGRYRLRSPNVLRLLGSSELIIDQLLQLEAVPPPPPFEAGSYRRPIEDDKRRRSPLTLSDEADLLKEGSKVRLLFGSNALGLNLISAAFKELEDSHTKVAQIDVSLALNPDRLIDQVDRWKFTGDGLSSDSVVMWIEMGAFPSKAEEQRKAIEALAARLAKRKKKDAVTVVVILGPAEARTWMSLLGAQRRAETEKLAPVLSLKRWSYSLIRRWTEDGNITPNAVDQQAIYDRTGGWSVLTDRLTDILSKSKGKEKVKEALAALDSPDTASAFASAMQLGSLPELRQLIELLQPGEAIGIEEASVYLEKPLETAEAWLGLGERLQLLVRDADRWRVDPIAAHYVRRAFSS
jgi:hypothetical protein